MTKLITKFRTLSLLLITFVAIQLIPQQTKACVMSDTVVIVTVDYDTTTWTDIVMTVSNFRLFGTAPNNFCSCAITNYTDVFTNINYIAFVDSGTTNPVAGFDVFNSNSNATTAWEAVIATGNWNGFVSMVGQAGLANNVPVELIVRASLPPGYTFVALDSNIIVTELGTDEWLDGTQSLSGAPHQQITDFWNSPWPTYVARDTAWFRTFDEQVLTGISGQQAFDPTFDLAPSPSSGEVMLSLELDQTNPITAIQVFNSSGQLIYEVSSTDYQKNKISLDLTNQLNGVYFVSVQTEKGMKAKKLVILR